MGNYTQKEVLENIEKLTKKSDSLKLQRTSLSQEINSLKKQIKVWVDIDMSQFKLYS